MKLENFKNYDINIIEYLNNTNPLARDRFLNTPDQEKPDFHYDNLNILQVNTNIADLNRELDLIKQKESTPERQFLTYYLDYLLLKNQFVSCCYLYQHASASEEKQILKEEQQNLCKKLYGAPDKDTFLSLLKRQLEKVEKTTLSEQDNDYFQKVKSLLPADLTTITESFHPHPKTIEILSQKLRAYYAPILKHIPEHQDLFTLDDACQIANSILKEVVNNNEEYWEAIIKPNASNASVDGNKKIVAFPGLTKTKTYTNEKLRALLIHEIGVHVFRHILFKKEKNKELTFSFPNYLTCEEGIAKVMEQAINGNYEESGIMHYISIGLATFYNLSFREVFTIQCLLFHHTENKNLSLCFNSVHRAFRGTGELSNNKDLVYYNGANLIWKYVEEHIDNPKLLENLLHSGKINILDDEHIRLRNLLWKI